jgi:SET domain-containing protein
MILPLLDYINHSREPNVVALPYHDPINNSSQVVIQAIKDISAGDQLQMSYGKLANTHSI